MEAGFDINTMACRQLQSVTAMVRRCIDSCPDATWTDTSFAEIPVWEHLYHAVSGIDFFIREPGRPFAFPPFHSDDAGMMRPGAKPVVSREQMREYLSQLEDRVRRLTREGEASAMAQTEGIFGRPMTLLERVVGQARHIQHHIGCVSVVLRRATGTAPEWID